LKDISGGRKLDATSTDAAGPRTGKTSEKPRRKALMVLQHKWLKAKLKFMFAHERPFISNFKARQSADSTRHAK
jgi:hypothetical protein